MYVLCVQLATDRQALPVGMHISAGGRVFPNNNDSMDSCDQMFDTSAGLHM